MDSAIGFTTFDTAIGVCGVAWGDNGLVGVQLPVEDALRVTDRFTQRFPSASEQAPPEAVTRCISDIQALLRGQRPDFADAPIDLCDAPEFNRRVFDIARRVLPGSTTTYGAIAEELGDRSVARAVGQALGHNPLPLIIPCHRVLAAGGQAGGFSAPGGVNTKLRILRIEGAAAAVVGQLGLFETGPAKGAGA